jgi:hypothetical protein
MKYIKKDTIHVPDVAALKGTKLSLTVLQKDRLMNGREFWLWNVHASLGVDGRQASTPFVGPAIDILTVHVNTTMESLVQQAIRAFVKWRWEQEQPKAGEDAPEFWHMLSVIRHPSDIRTFTALRGTSYPSFEDALAAMAKVHDMKAFRWDYRTFSDIYDRDFKGTGGHYYRVACRDRSIDRSIWKDQSDDGNDVYIELFDRENDMYGHLNSACDHLVIDKGEGTGANMFGRMAYNIAADELGWDEDTIWDIFHEHINEDRKDDVGVGKRIGMFLTNGTMHLEVIEDDRIPEDA